MSLKLHVRRRDNDAHAADSDDSVNPIFAVENLAFADWRIFERGHGYFLTLRMASTFGDASAMYRFCASTAIDIVAVVEE